MSAAEDLELRVVVPASALPSSSPRAEYFSQKNSLELLGLPPRAFLELLRREDAPEVTPVGRLRLVERETMLAFLRAMRRRPAPAARGAEDLDGADRVLAEIGCLATARGRVG